MEKVCKSCNTLQQHGVRTDGRTQSMCVGCKKDYSHKHYLANSDKVKARRDARRVMLREFVRELKAGPCADCAQTFHYSAMDFDHLRDKQYNMADLTCFGSVKKILAEVAKCDLVCANCHRFRTWQRIHSGVDKLVKSPVSETGVL